MERDRPDPGQGVDPDQSEGPASELATAIAALRRGELVHLPTETVYGLAADATRPDAVARIFAAKGRPRFNPLISHVSDLAMARRLGMFDTRAVQLAAAFWPGPLTLVVPASPDCDVCDLARAGLSTIALRQPAHTMALAVIAGLGRPLAAPSANRSGRPSPTCLADAIEETGAAVSVSLDGGPCREGLESTVLAVLPGEPVRWLRPGTVTRADVEALVGPLATGNDQAHRSPGRMSLHYAPDAPVRLDAVTAETGEALIGFGPSFPDRFNLSPSGDLTEAAANLFAMLRAADRTGPTAIAVAAVPDAGLGEAINDRLRRAAGFVG